MAKMAFSVLNGHRRRENFDKSGRFLGGNFFRELRVLEGPGVPKSTKNHSKTTYIHILDLPRVYFGDFQKVDFSPPEAPMWVPA